MHKTYRDPVTGDQMTRSELWSWRAQSIIRHWTFIGLFTVVTFGIWIVGSPAVVGWWNYSASFLAIVIESVVGIAMCAQVRRDALVLREIRRISERVESVAELIHEHQLRSER